MPGPVSQGALVERQQIVVPDAVGVSAKVRVMPSRAHNANVCPLPSLGIDHEEGIALRVDALDYLGIVASVFAHAIWGNLLQQYSAGPVAPFAPLSPCVGEVASAFVFGERFGPLRIGGIAFMLVGLAIVSVPIERLKALRMRMQ
jgi:EamA-like transporter family